MIEFIRQIPGPVFLGVFSAFSVLCIILMKMLIDADGSSAHAFPEHASLDSTSIAVLEGGVDSVIRSRVFNLVSMGLVVIENQKKNMRVYAAKKACPTGLSALDREVLAFLSTERTPRELFRDKGFRATIEGHLAGIIAGLQGRKFIKSKSQQGRAGRIALFFGTLIFALGGLKFYLGVTHNKPVAFLVILFFISEIVLFLVFKKRKYLTSAGRDYLKTLRKRFKWTLKRQTLPNGVDPALLVALYGPGHLYVSSLYPQYSDAFKRNATGAGCSGGCGGGGCSGGGCGGGCGGCGGD